MTASVDMTADVKPRGFGVERSGAAGHSERGQYGHSQCSDGVADMRAQPSALLIWLALESCGWLGVWRAISSVCCEQVYRTRSTGPRFVAKRVQDSSGSG